MGKRPKKKTWKATPTTGMVRLGDLLPQLISKYGIQQRPDVERLDDAWRRAVGEPCASITRVAGFRRGTLEIVVPHNAFVQELSFRQSELLHELQVLLPDEKVRKIRFSVDARPLDGGLR